MSQATAKAAVQARELIRPHIYETPLIPARFVCLADNSSVLFKAENFQKTGSFKIRGATSKMLAQRDGRPLITASKETGLAERHTQELAASGHYTYVSPYIDADIAAGQGTIALEILEQHAQIDNIFISMGGGGLISGIGSVLKPFSPSTKVFGVSTSHSKALATSISAGRAVEIEHKTTLADAVAGGIDEDTITLPIATSVVDELVECDEGEIADALKTLAWEEGILSEGSAALTLAGYSRVARTLSNQTSVVVQCGANYAQDSMIKILSTN